jgi:hypothetical protein
MDGLSLPRVSQAGSLSVFSLPYLTLSLPWLMELGGAKVV